MTSVDKQFICGVIISAILSFILAKINSVETFFKDHASWGVFGLFCALLIACVLLYCYQAARQNQYKLKLFSNTSTAEKRYSIILIDDEGSFRQRYKKVLKNFDITVLEKVDDVRILYGFDIVILDIVNASSLIGNNTHPIIDQLSFSKPSAYIIAISGSNTEISKCKSEKKVNNAILKDSEFDPNLKTGIKNAFEVLDNPQQYWDSNIKPKIQDENLLNTHKVSYINSLINNSNFKYD